MLRCLHSEGLKIFHSILLSVRLQSKIPRLFEESHFLLKDEIEEFRKTIHEVTTCLYRKLSYLTNHAVYKRILEIQVDRTRTT